MIRAVLEIRVGVPRIPGPVYAKLELKLCGNMHGPFVE